MNKPQTKYKRHDRISHNVDEAYDIAPAFDEIDMVKAIVKLYNSSLITSEAKEILKQGIK